MVREFKGKVGQLVLCLWLSDGRKEKKVRFDSALCLLEPTHIQDAAEYVASADGDAWARGCGRVRCAC